MTILYDQILDFLQKTDKNVNFSFVYEKTRVKKVSSLVFVCNDKIMYKFLMILYNTDLTATYFEL